MEKIELKIKKLNKEVEVNTNKFNEFFQDINSPVEELVVDIRNIYRGYNREEDEFNIDIVIKDCENKFHWADEIVRVKYTVSNENIKARFSSGSGGWNDQKFEADVVLKVYEESLRMARQCFHTTKANKSKFFLICKERAELNSVLLQTEQEYQNKLNKIELAKVQKKADKLMKDFTPVKDGIEIVMDLEEFLRENSKKEIQLVEVTFDLKTINIFKTHVSVENYNQRRFYIQHKNIGKGKLRMKDFTNFYYHIPEHKLSGWNTFRVAELN